MNGRYVSRKTSNQQCKAERFSNEVFQFGAKSAWPPFRDAVRDIWPVPPLSGVNE